MSDFHKNLAHLLEEKITASDEDENPARANDSTNFTSENRERNFTNENSANATCETNFANVNSVRETCETNFTNANSANESCATNFTKANSANENREPNFANVNSVRETCAINFTNANSANETCETYNYEAQRISEKKARNFFKQFSRKAKIGNVIKENVQVKKIIAVPAEVKKACTSLGVLPNQNLSEIKKVWKAKMKTFHPDASESDTNEKARNLIHAYKIIEKWKRK